MSNSMPGCTNRGKSDASKSLDALGGVPNVTQVGDMGIDGKLDPVNTKPSVASSAKTKHGETGVGIFANDWYPILFVQ